MHDIDQISNLKSELTHVQNQLKQKETIIDSILEGTMAGFWDWYIQDNYEYLSPSFKKMFGYEDHEMENTPEAWMKIMHPDDLKIVKENFNRYINCRGREPYASEVRFYHKSGAIIWVQCEGKVIEWDDNWNPIRMVGYHIDITKRKRLEVEKAYTLQLEKKNKELEKFAYVASHDLQEPINSIKSFADLLSSDKANQLSETSKQMLGFISESADRMGKLVLGLLEHSNIGLDRKVEEVDCNRLVQEVLKDLDKIIHDNSATFTIENLPKNLIGNETELRILFQNIISNGIKFHSNLNAPHITIGCSCLPEHYLFEIIDNGIGIEKKNYDKIFDIFTKLNIYKKYEGTGIGLAHCKKIVDLHHGKIWLESTQGEGTTFYFKLPK
ncbi:ATP-binding protein [Flammeovirga sp. EKP202]|uniref:sensor histidine kinase n=1 Tax=Flammeovirga sp. EKP202 TaxID=2770592 RepID=UPI00165FB115|nr:PAS domain-containing sensor histidine kinase [Flammeovirga sp. EKP202]MBD0402651.1 PAS domain-containing protein [Flammeovirga sp. EKP202]